jgi:hypothetical protein
MDTNNGKSVACYDWIFVSIIDYRRKNGRFLVLANCVVISNPPFRFLAGEQGLLQE